MSKLHPASYNLIIGLLPHFILLACIPLFLFQLQVVLVDGIILKVINAFIVAYILYILTQKSLRVNHSSKNIMKVKNDYSQEYLETCMQTGDNYVDSLVEKSIEMNYNQPIFYTTMKFNKELSNLYEFKQLEKELSNIPSWVDKKRIERGKQFYRDNLTPVFSGLVVGLIESYTFPSDAKVLEINGGLTDVNNTIERLSRTTQFVFDVINTGLPEFGSDEFNNIVNVRFIHAYVRKKCKESSEWNLPYTPINQFAVAATLNFFCQTPLELLKMKGISVSPEDCECCWQIWRYIGYLLGVEEDLLPKTYEHGLILRNNPIITKRQTPNEISSILTKTTLKALDIDEKVPINQNIFNVTLYNFLGENIHQQLDLPKPSLPAKLTLRMINFLWCHIHFCDSWSAIIRNWKNKYFKKYLLEAKVITLRT